MNEDDAFLSEVIPQLRQEITALHSGDAQPRKALWSHDDQVTLFGADLSGRGWSEIEPVFDRLAASFSGNGSGDYEVLGAGVSGDLGYVTTVLRREDGAWKIVHRHGHPFDDSAREMLAARKEQGSK